ncbi:hypothetical protein GQR36_06775 [Enterococcus termitis]
MEIPLHQRLLPHYPVPNDKLAGEFLKELCVQKLPQRVPDCSSIYEERLAKELDIIHTMGFDDYFLIVWDVMAFAHERKIVTGAGRGSAAGSLVSYVLSITDVDPIKYDLLFERFLNPERHSMPDIDLDIPDNRREEVLLYVREKYGHEHIPNCYFWYDGGKNGFTRRGKGFWSFSKRIESLVKCSAKCFKNDFENCV